MTAGRKWALSNALGWHYIGSHGTREGQVSSDVIINLFGEIDDIGVLTDIVRTGALEGAMDWGYETTMEEVADYVLKMAEVGGPVVLVASDVSNEASMFPHVRRLARSAGLSYVVICDRTGDEGSDYGFSWRPGFVDEVRYDMAGDDEPVVPIADLKTAMADSLEAVVALVTKVEEMAAVGSISVSRDVVDAYRGATVLAL
jgi:hypothetical protein